jgi:hypothetical protein
MHSRTAFASCLVRLSIALALLLGGLVASAPRADAQVVDSTLWSVDGTVYAMARDGNTLYVGGSFSRAASGEMGNLIPVDATTGDAPADFPKTDGSVSVVAPDGDGGWFVGGTFTTIGGATRANVARINADLSIASWNPGTDGTVTFIKRSGANVYLSGGFTTVGGQARAQFAAVDAATGVTTAFSAALNAPYGRVNALEEKADTVFVGGGFSTIGGVSRTGLAAVNRLTGALLGWTPNSNGTVCALRQYGGMLYVAGWFNSIGGASRQSLACLDPNTALATAWTANTNSSSAAVRTLDLSGSILYIGGDFTSIGGQSRNYIAAYNLSTGAILSWNPNAGYSVYQVAARGPLVYVGGYFQTVGGQPHRYAAAVDSATALPTAWDPGASAEVTGMSAVGNRIYLTGFLKYAGGPARSNIAAFDVTTGAPLEWAPGANGTVRSLVASGGRLYVGGDFTTLASQTRNRVGAFDTATGSLSSWDPNSSGSVYAITIQGSSVFLGGSFLYVGGVYHPNVAAVDATSGVPTSWYGTASGSVYALCSNGASLFVADYASGRVSALSIASGSSQWTVNLASVYALAVTGNTLFAGGGFTSFNGYSSYKYLVGLTATAGSVYLWNPGNSPNAAVTSLFLDGACLFAGGYFTTIGGATRSGVAQIDTTYGIASTWNPAGAATRTLTGSKGRLFAGGDFTTFGGRPHGRIASTTMPAPVISVAGFNGSASGYEGNAGWANTTCVVGLSCSSEIPISVDYSTADSTATVADGDYAAASGTFTFQPGESSRYISIPVNGDPVYEPDEAFLVRLSNPAGAAIAVPSAIGSLPNDDPAPMLSIRDVTKAEGASGGTPFCFAVRLSNPTYLPVSVNLTTADSTATVADGDYDAVSGLLTIPPKADSVVQCVTVHGDAWLELDEVFKVNLSSPVNAALADALGIGTILSDEMGPVITTVADVPGDQGGWVWLSLDRCLLDDPLVAQPVLTYNIWRKVPASPSEPLATTAAPRAVASDVRVMPDERTLGLMKDWPITVRDGGAYLAGAQASGPAAVFPPGTWGIVGSFAAMQQSTYLALAPAQADSPFVSEYVVSAHTTSPSVWVVGFAGSGRSVDNIAPGVPAPFAASQVGVFVSLAWGASTATDFQYFRLYRGTQADFATGSSSLVHQGIDLVFTDAAAGSGTVYYKLTALDHAGNESTPATASVAVVLDAASELPATFALRSPMPNPAMGAAAIPFALPRESRVNIDIFDTAGRLVRTLVDGSLEAGWHTARWDGRDAGGRRAPSGVYLCRMSAPGYSATRTLVLLH